MARSSRERPLDIALEEANDDLKRMGLKVRIGVNHDKLTLRATLPERTGNGARKQHRLGLGLAAETRLLPTAFKEAERLGIQIRRDTFSWEEWGSEPAESTPTELELTVEDFHRAAKQLHAAKYRRKPPENAEAIWGKKWRPALNKIPPSGAITEDVLLRVIRKMPPESAARRDQGNVITQIADSLGLPIEKLREAYRGYSAEELSPRKIPSDKEILEAFASIRLPRWKWMFGVCAAYGLRPHECAELTWQEDDWIRVHEETKTGSRLVTPCPADWVRKLDLHRLPRPTQGAKQIGKVFCDALNRDGIVIDPYDLRHAFALRLLSKGVPTDTGARLMGHSPQVHHQTYRRWIAEDQIKEDMKGIRL